MSPGSYFPGRGTLVEETFLAGVAKGKAEGKTEAKAEGKAEATAEWVVCLLENRGIAVPAEVRERVIASGDLDQLTRWFDRAVTVTDARDIFLDPENS